ncbi:hypothetical protein M0R19_05570 [Candidatus Pacearchaeota archaeon]|jgi:hypothetical protein|nr:hypothetical protein [Candidatus Pacearchaeota archaeon]
MNVLEITKDYLIKNGYDGLYTHNCNCLLSNLMPCCDVTSDCKPGYKLPCDCDGGCAYHMSPTKDKKFIIDSWIEFGLSKNHDGNLVQFFIDETKIEKLTKEEREYLVERIRELATRIEEEKWLRQITHF